MMRLLRRRKSKRLGDLIAAKLRRLLDEQDKRERGEGLGLG